MYFLDRLGAHIILILVQLLNLSVYQRIQSGVSTGMGLHGMDFMYGAEYETNTLSDYMSTLVHHDVQCAVCLVCNRSVLKMFPGKTKEGIHYFPGFFYLQK